MGTNADGPTTQDLQFDQVELDGGPVPVVCAQCSTAIADSYYQLGDKILCQRCRFDLELRQRAAPSGRLGRVVRAVVAGSLAAALGSGLWFGVRWITGGWEFGLLAIVVGVMVGVAVRWGSGGRGGLGYQLLAVFLTYNAIVVTYIPTIIEGFKEASKKAEGTSVSSTQPAESGTDVGRAEQGPAPGAGLRAVSDVEPGPDGQPTAGSEAATSEAATLNPVLAVVGLALLLVFAYVTPFLAVMADVSAVLGLVIIGIGLWEAWKINRRRVETITGPFRVGVVAKSDQQS